MRIENQIKQPMHDFGNIPNCSWFVFSLSDIDEGKIFRKINDEESFSLVEGGPLEIDLDVRVFLLDVTFYVEGLVYLQ